MSYPTLEALAVDYYRRLMRVVNVIHGKGEAQRELVDICETADPEFLRQYKQFGVVLNRTKKGVRVIKRDLEDILAAEGYNFKRRDPRPIRARLICTAAPLCPACQDKKPKLVRFDGLDLKAAYEKLEAWYISDQHKSVMGINWYVNRMLQSNFDDIQPGGSRLYVALTDVYASISWGCTCMINTHQRNNPQKSRIQIRDYIARRPQADAVDITYNRDLCKDCEAKRILT